MQFDSSFDNYKPGIATAIITDCAARQSAFPPAPSPKKKKKHPKKNPFLPNTFHGSVVNSDVLIPAAH
jgi:hypothetical protein